MYVCVCVCVYTHIERCCKLLYSTGCTVLIFCMMYIHYKFHVILSTMLNAELKFSNYLKCFMMSVTILNLFFIYQIHFNLMSPFLRALFEQCVSPPSSCSVRPLLVSLSRTSCWFNRQICCCSCSLLHSCRWSHTHTHTHAHKEHQNINSDKNTAAEVSVNIL